MKIQFNHSIHFTDHTTVPHHHRAKYLGVILRDDCSSLTDINARIGKVRAGFKKLQQFWRHTNITQHFKLKIYKATFIPMLTYGLESAAITQSQFNRLNAVHSNCIRKILGIKATYYTEVLDPTQTTYNNSTVLQLANMPTLQAIIQDRQLRYLGHVYRCQPCDLEKEVVFTGAYVYRGRGGKQRKGHRRVHWLEQSSRLAWSLIQELENPDNPQPFFAPYTYMQLIPFTADRVCWQGIVDLPTSKELATDDD